MNLLLRLLATDVVIVGLIALALGLDWQVGWR
jgi:hypothetical protein